MTIRSHLIAFGQRITLDISFLRSLIIGGVTSFAIFCPLDSRHGSDTFNHEEHQYVAMVSGRDRFNPDPTIMPNFSINRRPLETMAR